MLQVPCRIYLFLLGIMLVSANLVAVTVDVSTTEPTVRFPTTNSNSQEWKAPSLPINAHLKYSDLQQFAGWKTMVPAGDSTKPSYMNFALPTAVPANYYQRAHVILAMTRQWATSFTAGTTYSLNTIGGGPVITTGWLHIKDTSLPDPSAGLGPWDVTCRTTRARAFGDTTGSGLPVRQYLSSTCTGNPPAINPPETRVYPVLEVLFCQNPFEPSTASTNKCITVAIAPNWIQVREGLVPSSSLSTSTWQMTADSGVFIFENDATLHDRLWPNPDDTLSGPNKLDVSLEMTCTTVKLCLTRTTPCDVWQGSGPLPVGYESGSFNINHVAFLYQVPNSLGLQFSTALTTAAPRELSRNTFAAVLPQLHVNTIEIHYENPVLECVFCHLTVAAGRIAHRADCKPKDTATLSFALTIGSSTGHAAEANELGLYVDVLQSMDPGTHSAVFTFGAQSFNSVLTVVTCSTPDDPALGPYDPEFPAPGTVDPFSASYEWVDQIGTTRRAQNIYEFKNGDCLSAGAGLFPVGSRCSTDADCQSNVCTPSGNSKVGKVCRANHCFGPETIPGFTPSTFPFGLPALEQCALLVMYEHRDCVYQYCGIPPTGTCTLCIPSASSSPCHQTDPSKTGSSCINDSPVDIFGDKKCNAQGFCIAHTLNLPLDIISRFEVREGEILSILNLFAYMSAVGPWKSGFAFFIAPDSITISGHTFSATVSEASFAFTAPIGDIYINAESSALVDVLYYGTKVAELGIPMKIIRKEFPVNAVDSTHTVHVGQVVRGALKFETLNNDPRSSMRFTYVGPGNSINTTLNITRPSISPGTRPEYQIPMAPGVLHYGSLFVDGLGNYEFHSAHGIQTTVSFSFMVEFPAYDEACKASPALCSSTPSIPIGTVTMNFQTFVCRDTASTCPEQDRFHAVEFLPSKWENRDGVRVSWDNNALWLESDGKVGHHYQRVSSFREIKFVKEVTTLDKTDTYGPLVSSAIPTASAAFNRDCLTPTMPWLQRFDANVETFCADHAVAVTDDTTWRSDLCTNAPLLSAVGPWQMSMHDCNYTYIRMYNWNDLRTDPNWSLKQDGTNPVYYAYTEFYNQALQPASWYLPARGWWDEDHKYLIRVTIQGEVTFVQEFQIYECDLQWNWLDGKDIAMNLNCFCKLHPDTTLCGAKQQCLGEGKCVPDECKITNPETGDEQVNPDCYHIPPPECRTLHDTGCVCIAEQGMISADPTFWNMLGLSIYMCRTDDTPSGDQPTAYQKCYDKFRATNDARYIKSNCHKYCGRVQVRLFLSIDFFQEIWFFYCYMTTSVNVDGGFVGLMHTCRANPYVELTPASNSVSDYPGLCEMKETNVYSPTDINTVLYEIPNVASVEVEPCEVVADYFNPFTSSWVVLDLRTKTGGVVAHNNDVTALLEYTELPKSELKNVWKLSDTDFGFAWRPGILNLNVKMRINTTLCIVEKKKRMRDLEAPKETFFTQSFYISRSFDSAGNNKLNEKLRAAAKPVTASGPTNNYGSRSERQTIIIENVTSTPISVILGVCAVGVVCIFLIALGAFVMGRRLKTGSLWAPRPTTDTRSASEVAIELSEKA